MSKHDDQHHHSFNAWIDEMALKFPGRNVEEEVLEAIVNSERHRTAKDPVTDHNGVHLSDAFAHDAINYTLSGTITFEGVDYGFIINDGNWNGTSVIEWGLDEDVGSYEPPPPTIYTMIPATNNIRMGYHGYSMFKDVYLAWRKEAWFEKICRDYMYDKHFAPGSKISEHYRGLASKRGMKLATSDEFDRLMAQFNELEAIVGKMTHAEKTEYFNQQDAVFAAAVRMMSEK
jgi:hypothetical protein